MAATPSSRDSSDGDRVHRPQILCRVAGDHRLISVVAIALGLTTIAVFVARTSDLHVRGYADSEWIKKLTGPDPDERVRAADALGAILAMQPRNAPAVKALVRALDDSLAIVQGAAAAAISAAAVRQTDALPLLLVVLRDSVHPLARLEAITVLGTLGASSVNRPVPSSIDREALAALTLALWDREPMVRAAAVREIARTRRVDARVTTNLLRLAADSSRDVRVEVASALGAITPATPAALEALSLLSRDPMPEVAAAAQRSLTWLAAMSGGEGCAIATSASRACSRTR